MKFSKFDSGRIISLDILRGYFLLVIIFNHLGIYPNGFDILTGRGILYASTAEGFFLVSGIVLGIVRGRKLVDRPFKDTVKIILKRALQLYAAAVVMTLIFTLLAWAFTGMPGVKTPSPSPNIGFWNMVWQTITLNNIYGWTDFLRQYAIFIAIAPLAVWLLRRGLWHIVLAASLAAWFNFPTEAADTFFMQPIAWQLVFFLGLIIGFHWPELRKLWSKIPKVWANLLGVSLFILFIATVIISALLVFGKNIDGQFGQQLVAYNDKYIDYFSKDRLPYPRLIVGAIWFWALFWFVNKFEPWLKKHLGWLFIPLGQNSLYVYIVQGLIVFFFHIFILDNNDITTPEIIPQLNYFVFSVLVATLVWLLVRYKVLFKIIPR